jgi:uncharacterized membrane protein YcjF (UPF0283 family)
MNLRAIHAIVILFSAALALLVGLYCLDTYRQHDGIATLAASVASFAASLGLVVYDSWFLRQTRELR